MLKKILLILIVTILMFTPVFLKSKASYDSPHTYESLPTEVILSEYDIELEEWIEKLAACESGLKPLAINENDGGSESIGYVQYKRDTWRRYNAKFNLPYTDEDIWSKEAQIAVTKEVIRQDYAWKNWWNCTQSIGLPPKAPQTGV